jgi:hypothetical protein
MGWTYWELMDCPPDVYLVLVETLRAELDRGADRDAA